MAVTSFWIHKALWQRDYHFCISAAKVRPLSPSHTPPVMMYGTSILHSYMRTLSEQFALCPSLAP
eukprot:2112288-Rhodomonas_salina.2